MEKHADLVARQAKAREVKKVEHERKKDIRSDTERKGDDLVRNRPMPRARLTLQGWNPMAVRPFGKLGRAEAATIGLNSTKLRPN